MRRLVALSILSMASAVPARAADIGSTDGLLGMCKSTGAAYGYCLGLISGMAAVMEQVGLNTSGQFRSRMGMCVSAPYPSANAEVQVFINWAQQNPKFLGTPGAVGVTIALANAWPCGGQR
jgi:hypothetical protein